MKRVLLLFAIITSLQLPAQDERLTNIRQVQVPFNGGNYNGNEADIAAPPEMVQDIIINKFAAQGVKGREINGFLVFRNVIIRAIDTIHPMDAFIKVERKNKKEKENSTISLIATRPGEIPDEKFKSGTPATIATAAAVSGSFLTGLAPDIDQKVFEKNVAEKQQNISQAERKLKSIQDDQAILQNKLKILQDELLANKINLDSQAAEIEKLRKDLDEYEAKKRGSDKAKSDTKTAGKNQ